MMKIEKEKCDCGKIATWWYAPASERDFGNRYFCDEHVHRGCSCNHHYVDVNAYSPPLEKPDLPTDADLPWKWIEENVIWCYVDEEGRELPCCEYWYDKDGFEMTYN